MLSRHVVTAKRACDAFSKKDASIGGRVQSCGGSNVFQPYSILSLVEAKNAIRHLMAC